MTTRELIIKYGVLVSGFMAVALGLSLTLQSALGMGPWGAFQVGLAQISGLTVGRATQLVSLFALALAWILTIRPNTTSILNMVCVGQFMDWFLHKIPPVGNSVLLRLTVFVVGLLCFSFGISLYLRAGLGSGPRESLMLGLHLRFGFSIRRARTTMDATVLVASILLGGPIGAGTILHTIGSGPLIQFFMTVLGKTEPAPF